MGTTATPAAALLDDISAQSNEAIETLRELARGIFPPLLADRGLVAALRGHLAKGSASVQLEVASFLILAAWTFRRRSAQL